MHRFVLLAALCLPLALFAQTAPTPLDGIVPDSQLAERRVLPYPPLRQADGLWQKRVWRLIDTREKINLPFKYAADEDNGNVARRFV